MHTFFLLNQKKKAAENHRLQVKLSSSYVYVVLTSDHAPTIRKQFRHFKRGDFNVDDKERPGSPKTFEYTELLKLLNEDQTKTQQQ